MLKFCARNTNPKGPKYPNIGYLGFLCYQVSVLLGIAIMGFGRYLVVGYLDFEGKTKTDRKFGSHLCRAEGDLLNYFCRCVVAAGSSKFMFQGHTATHVPSK